jgi:hypothetical protein
LPGHNAPISHSTFQLRDLSRIQNFLNSGWHRASGVSAEWGGLRRLVFPHCINFITNSELIELSSMSGVGVQRETPIIRTISKQNWVSVFTPEFALQQTAWMTRALGRIDGSLLKTLGMHGLSLVHSMMLTSPSRVPCG